MVVFGYIFPKNPQKRLQKFSKSQILETTDASFHLCVHVDVDEWMIVIANENNSAEFVFCTNEKFGKVKVQVQHKTNWKRRRTLEAEETNVGRMVSFHYDDVEKSLR